MPPRILLASRLPDELEDTVRVAVRLANQLQGELLLVYVAVELTTVPSLHAATGEDSGQLRARMISDAERRASEYLDRHLGREASGVWIVEGDVAEEVVRLAAAERVDYLVIGTEQRSRLRQIILGTTSERILNSSPCPVVVVPSSSG